MALTKVKSGMRTLATDEVTATEIAAGAVGASEIASTFDISSKTVTLPASAVTAAMVQAHATSFDDNQLKEEIALLGFKAATNGSLAKYNLVDQTEDVFSDATGINASASTAEIRSTSGKYYSGTIAIGGSGGTTTTVGGYTWHFFGSTGNYVVTLTHDVDIIIVGGGGSGSIDHGGGGGGGGVAHVTGYEVTAQTYVAEPGAGGAAGYGGHESGSQRGQTSRAYSNGSESGINTYFKNAATTVLLQGNGGGGAGAYGGGGGRGGGSGGGAGSNAGSGGSASAGSIPGGATGATYANSGGSSGSPNYGGGGGGAGGAGSATSAGYGGNGIRPNTLWDAFGTDDQNGAGGGYFGGGGAGGGQNSNAVTNDVYGGYGGAGGYGDSSPTGARANHSMDTDDAPDGIAYTGGGGAGALNWGGGTQTAGSGGSGVVIIRRTADAYADITLVSNSTTAETQPTKADFVMTVSAGIGSFSLGDGTNGDVRAFVSRDNGTTYTQFTLTDQGDTAGHTILTAHDLTISGQPAGTTMLYKVTTHGQQAAVKETRIHAVSLGWS